MANIEKMLEEIEKMTVIELADLVKAIEEKFGVSAAAVAAPAAAKGQYIKGIAITTTMGPGIKVAN